MPIEMNAMANHTVRKPFKVGPPLFAVVGDNRKENTKEAAIKPNTNFGNRYHIIFNPGRSALSVATSLPLGFL